MADMISYFPKYFTNRSILLYLLLLLLIPMAFGCPMAWYWWVFGLVEVVCFFYFSYLLSRGWQNVSGTKLEGALFSTSLCIRLLYVLFSYALYFVLSDNAFEFSAGDSLWYDAMGRLGADLIWGRNVGEQWGNFFSYAGASDIGYPLYLSAIYAITGKSILITRAIKAIMSAYTVVLVYRLASRNFGDVTGRMAAVFCVLMPNLIYYCGMHLKETEMLFLAILFIERADALFRRNKIHVRDIILLLVIGISTFFFRAVLCYVLFLTLVASVVFGSKRIKRGGKWAIEGLLLVILCIFGYFQVGSGMGESDEFQNITEQQEINMQWRSERKGGNSYAKYASSTVFLPLMFTIPFPTMVNIEGQQNQQMIHGGNYIKNITSFLTILAIVILLLNGRWKDNVVPLAFMCGYLLVLAFSSYAHSERFHIPSLPIELMFAAYGVTHFKAKHKNWFTVWLIAIFVANIGWTWFKLRGRGL